MTKILVVDDSAVDRKLTGSLLEKRAGSVALEKDSRVTVIHAVNGREALDLIPREHPDLVLTDLQMPEMNGLELVEAVKNSYPAIPVILMTAHGSEDIAVTALEKGAASYVPKKKLASDLLETVDSVLASAGARRQQQRLVDECWLQTESHFLLPNDLSHISPLVNHLQENLTRMKVCDENDLIRVAVALREALNNAIVHGNLEVSSELREQDERRYYSLMDERRQREPYRSRVVMVIAEESRAEAVYIVRDEGQGFDTANLPDPTDPANLEKVSGRGLLLIRTFMDEVQFNQKGNEITMTKRRVR
jgi:CheY-like chemotaxis protein/anti-sigma regulatory factor (Ser/Thr protein kinase)